jgi:uncharacterized protein with HEPN domain
MPLDEQVRSYLWDIREAAHEIHEFLREIKFHEFEKNKVLRYAVERQLLVIGEAAVIFLLNSAKNTLRLTGQG